MKPPIFRLCLVGIISFLLIACPPGTPASAQDTTQQPSSDRPLVVIQSYFLNQDTISPGQSFILYLSIKNQGALDAHNLIFGFSGEDFLPQETGGVVAVGSLGPGGSKDIAQPLIAGTSLWGKTTGTVQVRLDYAGPAGETYSEAFLVTLDVLGWSGTSATATPTPTATASPRAQMVVSGYFADVDPLQPGTIFNLEMDIQNLGNGDARGVTMVLGGGTSGVTGTESTPQPGGISGSGAELSTFAPLGSSNLQYMGDVPAGAVIQANQQLIVNVSANPGAYTLKLSFVYSDMKGYRIVDDQIITLLIYQVPQIAANFYRDPGVISAGMPNTLPIQVVNLGRKSAVMGNMTITAENAELMNNVTLVGALDAGGYFPLDVMIIPSAPGPMDVTVTINYTDDFNQARTIVQTIPIEVVEGAVISPGMENPGMEPGMGPGGEGIPVDPVIMPAEETFWQKMLRFFKGLVGLDSAPPQQDVLPGEILPGEIPPSEGVPGQPVPASPGGKG